MDTFRLEEKESFQVIGYKITTTNQKKAGRDDIPKFWQSQGSKMEALLSKMNQEPYGVLGINVYNIDANDARVFEYYIAVSSTCKEEGDFVRYQVPKALWAIFPCTKETMGKTEAMAITKYLPKSGYRALNKGYITGKMNSQAPDIEYYGKGDDVEVWVAVEKK